MRDSVGQHRSPPTCVQSFRKTQDAGAGAREDLGPGLPRTRSNMNLAVAANDDTSIEVLASGLPLFFGAQLAVDITVRSALAADGTPQTGAARVDGAVCTRARVDKERTYTELLRGDRCRLVVVALETGGRWSEEALQFVESLAAVRARDAPPALFHSAALRGDDGGLA